MSNDYLYTTDLAVVGEWGRLARSIAQQMLCDRETCDAPESSLDTTWAFHLQYRGSLAQTEPPCAALPH